MGRSRIEYQRVTRTDSEGKKTISNYFPQTVNLKAWCNTRDDIPLLNEYIITYDSDSITKEMLITILSQAIEMIQQKE